MHQSDPLNLSLDEAFIEWAMQLKVRHQLALIAWQGLDRYYDEIQRAVEDGQGSEALTDTVAALLEAIDLGRTPHDLVVWRGVRSCSRTFGTHAARLKQIKDTRIRVKRFFATTTEHTVALHEFTQPPDASGAALMRIRLPAHTPAAWLRALSSDELTRSQCELLLAPGHDLMVTDVHSDVSNIGYSNSLEGGDAAPPIIDVRLHG